MVAAALACNSHIFQLGSSVFSCQLLIFGDRLAALVELWVRLVDHPQAEALMKAMVQKPVNRFDSFVDTLLNELLITGIGQCFLHLMFCNWFSCIAQKLGGKVVPLH